MKKESNPLRPLASRLGLAFTLAPFLAGPALAATFTVSNLSDSGPGSLRQAVLDANASPGADDVVFTPGLTGTIMLTSGEILIADSLTVHGPGAGVITVSGNDQSRIFHVENPADFSLDVTLSGLTLTHGSAVIPLFGGAVFALNQNLTILDSVISSSKAGYDLAGIGCGGNVFTQAGMLRIANSTLTGGASVGSGGNLCVAGGRLILERSTLSGGFALSGGGLYANNTVDSMIFASTISGNVAGLPASDFGFGGGLQIDGGHMQIVNSTISGNSVNGDGGGLVLFQSLGGSLLLRLTTVSSNTATGRGGSLLIGTSDEVELDHSIVANGAPQDLAPSDPNGPPVTITANYSLIENPGDVALTGSHNLIGADPLLGPLASNGGPTLTHLPLPGSPVIDAGDPAIPSPPATDQRGFSRIAGAAVDLGSVETGQAPIDVPALSTLGLALLALLLGAAGLRIQARRRTARELSRQPMRRA